jgi:hypothetical protein
MLTFGIEHQGFDEMIEAILDLQSRVSDLRPLADDLAQAMYQQNTVARTLGEDRYGQPFVELAPSTLRKRVRQGRLGPPLAPDGGGSPIAAGFRVEPEVIESNDILVRGTWPTAPWVKYHIDDGSPRSHLPVRDPAGITPAGWEQIATTFQAFCARLIGQTY